MPGRKSPLYPKVMNMTGTSETEHNPLHAKNYCVGFVDLLGQRAALRNQHLVVPSADDPKHADFIKAIRSSVGAIIKLQEDARVFLEQSGRSFRPPQFDSDEKQAAYEAMRRTHRKEQWWSDGILLYASLAEADGPCPMNGVYEVIVTLGCLCLLGLAQRRPIRGSVDVAWGVEIREGQFYGAALSRAYQLESEVAGYPRIVVSADTVEFLNSLAHSTAPLPEDYIGSLNRELGGLCLQFLTTDADGYVIIDYLGAPFQALITGPNHPYLYSKAREFVTKQREAFTGMGDSKLAFRYALLDAYFESNPPIENQGKPTVS